MVEPVAPNTPQTAPAAGSPAGAGVPPQPPIAAQKKKKKGKKRGRGVIIAVAIIVLGIITVALLMSSKGEEGTTVEVTAASYRTIVQTVTATGVIEPQTQLKISSEVSGEIVYLAVKEGDVVSQGEVIVRINPESMNAQLDQGRAAISGAQAREAQAAANLMRAEADLGRLKQLFEKKLATAQEMDAAENQVRVARAEVDAARFGTQQSRASLRQMQESVAKTTIVAPMSGVVTKLNSKLGEKVVGSNMMAGTEIMTIADLSTIEAVVDVSETDVVQVSLGDPAEIEFDAIPDRKYRAVVSAIANSPKTSMGGMTQEQITNFQVRLRILEPDSRFRPGMTATATIQTERAEKVLAVPIQSVTAREEKDSLREEVSRAGDDQEATNVRLDQGSKPSRPDPVVFVRSGDSVIVRKVKTGVRDNEFIQVTGLKPGEEVVSGSYKAISKDLENGSKIVIEKEKKAARKKSAGAK
jgi:HlyD family secretion protein